MRCRWEFGLRHLLGAFRGWAFEDFAAGTITTTSVTLSDNENGTYPYVFNSDKIVNSTAVIVRTSDPTKKAYTGTTKLFSSKVSVSAHTGTSITLSGVPHSTWGDLRIYYFYQYDYGMPVGYTIPSRAVAEGILSELQDLLISEEEIGDGSKDAVFNSIENTPVGASTPSTGKFTSITDGTATLTGGVLSGIDTLTATTITDGTATLTGGVLTGATGHDNFSDFVAAEHLSLPNTVANVLSDGDFGSKAVITTGSGRFDGGIGVGVAPGVAGLINLQKSASVPIKAILKQTGIGDIQLEFHIGTTTYYSLGIDNSDGDKLKLAVGLALETNTALAIDTSGNFDFQSGNFAGVGTIACGDITGGIYNGVTISTDASSMLLDDVTNSQSIQTDTDCGIIDNTDGFYIFGGATPRQLTVTGGDWEINHTPLDWTSASVGTIDATNIEDKFLRNDGDDEMLGKLTITKTTEQLRLAYDAENYVAFIVNSAGLLVLDRGGVAAPGLDLTDAGHLYLADIHSLGDTLQIWVGDPQWSFLKLYQEPRGGQSELTVNLAGNDVDFIVESVNQANMLFVDAANDRVGIANANPTVALDVTGAALISTTLDAGAYKVGGTAGCDFDGVVTNITVVKGIVTAAS